MLHVDAFSGGSHRLEYDVRSLGCLFYGLFTGAYPFEVSYNPYYIHNVTDHPTGIWNVANI